MNEKPNCYKCKHRAVIPGDAHSRCTHPAVNPNTQFGSFIDTLMGRNTSAAVKLGISGNEIGIRHGWFMWPSNFDPVWLQSCNGFESSAVEANQNSAATAPE